MSESDGLVDYVIFRLRPVDGGNEVWLPDANFAAGSREEARDKYVDAVEKHDPPEDLDGVPLKIIATRFWEWTTTVRYDRVRRFE